MGWKEGAMEVVSNFGGDIMIPVTDISRINYNKATWTFGTISIDLSRGVTCDTAVAFRHWTGPRIIPT